MEENKKKTAAAKSTAKKAKVEPTPTEAPVTAPKKAKAKPAAENPATTQKASSKKVAAVETGSSAVVKPKRAAAKKAAAPEKEAAATVEKPKRESAKKAAAPEKEAAATVEKPKRAAAKKAAAPEKEAAAAVEKPKRAAAKKAAAPEKEAAATVEKPKRAAAKKAAAPEKEAAATVEKPKRAAAKKKSAAPEPQAPAAESSAVEPAKKVRTKPRRRELKRLGLLKPKQNKKQARHDAAVAAKQSAAPSSSTKPAEPAAKTKAPKPGNEATPKAPASKNATSSPKGRDHKVDGKNESRANEKGKKSTQAPQFPAEFEGFKRQLSPKLERKNERKQERLEKAERQYDQSQGLFQEPIRLNRFVALSGVCSRRDADALIADGKVKVNGKVVREMGFKVQPGKDIVVYKEHELRIKVFVYLLMNKPKNKITTTDDELGRDTVMEIAERYTKARVYPVGRLDRNTTGLLLLTNDGDLTQKLTHPSSKFPKVYQARLDKEISEEDLQALRKGFELEDGFIKADKVEYVDGVNFDEIGIQIHSGANHIVKRMLAHLGYEVIALDRVQLGPLNKRGLSRGTCRLLTEKEIGFLKML